MAFCLCCSHSVVRCVSRGRLYWFCSHCRQEMIGVESRGTNDTNLGGDRTVRLHKKRSFLGIEGHLN